MEFTPLDQAASMTSKNCNRRSATIEGTYPLTMEDIMKIAMERKCSDIHITPGAPPIFRINGDLIPLEYTPLKPEQVRELLVPLLEPWQWEVLREKKELDFAYSMIGIARFRGNVMWQRGTLAIVYRLVPVEPIHLQKLGLPSAVRDLCYLSRGLVLFTGPAGSGKSTSLAAIINVINEERKVNIITIEDPIEFLHRHKKSIVKQREIGSDTLSFAHALRHALRHDPDVILVGEMRDLESIAIALTAAETGHLVFSTLHTQTAPLAIARVVDVFPQEARNQVRHQLANSLQAICAQKLIKNADGSSRVVAAELMLVNHAVSNMIREGKEHQLYSVIQTSRGMGMQTMDQALAALQLAGKISREAAFRNSVDKKELERLLMGGQGAFTPPKSG